MAILCGKRKMCENMKSVVQYSSPVSRTTVQDLVNGFTKLFAGFLFCLKTDVVITCGHYCILF